MARFFGKKARRADLASLLDVAGGKLMVHDSAFLGALPVVVADREREIEAARVLKCREVKDTSGGEKEKRGWDIECPGEGFLWGSRSMGATGTVPKLGGRYTI